MIKLYDYQEKLIQQIRSSFQKGNKRVVLCAPTGAGKTVMFSYMISEHIKRGGKVLVLTDRKKLLDQATSSFHHFGIDPQHIIAKNKDLDPEANCTVAMIETLYRRKEQYKDFIYSCTLVVVDEAHKTCFEKIFQDLGINTFVIGATATPFRKGNQPAMDLFYTDIIQEVDTPDLISIGKLSKCRTFGLQIPKLEQVKKTAGDFDLREMGKIYDENKIYDGVVKNYRKHTPNTKAICFASTIKSAQNLNTEIKAAGIESYLICSEYTPEQNDKALERFEAAAPDEEIILINVGILTAGYDCPNIRTVILYRATTSLPLFLQMVGRGSRITDDKNQFFLLDFGNNVKRHNFWEAPRLWTLEKKRKKQLGAAPVKECPMCESFLPVSARECEYCGHEFEETKEEKTKREIAELKELSRKELLALAKVADVKKKVLMCKQGLVKSGYVLHQMTDINEARLFCSLMGYKDGFEYYNRDRFKVFR